MSKEKDDKMSEEAAEILGLNPDFVKTKICTGGDGHITHVEVIIIVPTSRLVRTMKDELRRLIQKKE